MQQLLKEILEQPRVLSEMLDQQYDNIVEIARYIREHDCRQVLIAARGTSDNAATYAKYVLGTRNRLPVALAAPSMYTIYQRPPRLSNTLVMAISQSGASPDIVSVIEDAREQGMPTVAITNVPGSRLARAAERVIDLGAGEERSVAATKTYTAELLAVALLSTALDKSAADRRALRAVPGAVAAILESHESIRQRTERYRYMAHSAVIARGFNYATAFEIALKLKELTYCEATPYSSADFMHGPFAILERGFPLIVAAPGGAMLPSVAELVERARDREAELIIISDRQDLLAKANTRLCLPATLPEWLSPIAAIIPGQLFALYLALSKGLDPESPRGLHKVTETR